jgi:hypothetical protein
VSDPPAIQHHRAVEYQRVEHPPQSAGFTVVPSENGRQIEVSGICAGCGGYTTTTWVYGIGSGYKGWPRHTRPAAKPTGMKTIICDCGHTHANRPEEEPFHGCGSYWLVELP